MSHFSPYVSHRFHSDHGGPAATAAGAIFQLRSSVDASEATFGPSVDLGGARIYGDYKNWLIDNSD